MMLLLFLSFNTHATTSKDIKALVVEVKGAVTALLPNQTQVIKLKSSTTIPEGSEISLPADSELVWYKQLYGKIEREELYGPAVIHFPGKFLGKEVQIAGQRALGGIVRGDEESEGKVNCHYPEQIRLPETDISIPFLKFTCRQAPDYSKVRYVITQNAKQISSGTFFEGFKNANLSEGTYSITFYLANNKLVQSSLYVDDFDLDSQLSKLPRSKESSLPTDLMATMELCQLGYRYLCETNLEYRYIYKDQTSMSTKDRIVAVQLKALIRDSLAFNH